MGGIVRVTLGRRVKSGVKYGALRRCAYVACRVSRVVCVLPLAPFWRLIEKSSISLYLSIISLSHSRCLCHGLFYRSLVPVFVAALVAGRGRGRVVLLFY